MLRLRTRALLSATSAVGCGLILVVAATAFHHPSARRTLAFVRSAEGTDSSDHRRRSSSAATRRTLRSSSSDENEEASSSSSSSSSPVATTSNVGTYNPFRLAVLKLGFTEPRFTSPLNYEKRAGSYACAGCGAPLFSSRGKYDSGSGWPSFYKTAAASSIDDKGSCATLTREWDGRTEVSCERCGGHLGHVFMDGPRRDDLTEDDLSDVPSVDPPPLRDGPGGRYPRFCVNGASLRFVAAEDQ